MDRIMLCKPTTYGPLYVITMKTINETFTFRTRMECAENSCIADGVHAMDTLKFTHLFGEEIQACLLG